MTTPTWTLDRVASRIGTLVAEHGCPNQFQLHEVAGDVDRVAVLAISRVVRLERLALNRRLQGDRLTIAYQSRRSADQPAGVLVSALDR